MAAAARDCKRPKRRAGERSPRDAPPPRETERPCQIMIDRGAISSASLAAASIS